MCVSRVRVFRAIHALLSGAVRGRRCETRVPVSARSLAVFLAELL